MAADYGVLLYTIRVYIITRITVYGNIDRYNSDSYDDYNMMLVSPVCMVQFMLLFAMFKKFTQNFLVTPIHFSYIIKNLR